MYYKPRNGQGVGKSQKMAEDPEATSSRAVTFPQEGKEVSENPEKESL